MLHSSKCVASARSTWPDEKLIWRSLTTITGFFAHETFCPRNVNASIDKPGSRPPGVDHRKKNGNMAIYGSDNASGVEAAWTHTRNQNNATQAFGSHIAPEVAFLASAQQQSLNSAAAGNAIRSDHASDAFISRRLQHARCQNQRLRTHCQ